jgi:hypothetical protein
MRKILLFIVVAAIVGVACADAGYFQVEDVSIYSPDHFVQKSLSPFFYNPEVQYNDDGFDQDFRYRFDSINVQEWHQFFGSKVQKEDLRLILALTEDNVNKYYNNLKDEIPSDNKFQSILNYSDRAKVLDFLKYLANAKHAETYAKKMGLGSWEYNAKKTIFHSEPAFEKQLSTLFSKTTDSFIKQRYLFQWVRYAYFNKSDAYQILNMHTQNFPKNTIYYRSLSYAAGASKKIGKISESNYLYSLVFDNCQALKTIAHAGFRPQEDKDWNMTLGLAQSSEEKETLWAMLGIKYSDASRAIQEIYKLNSKSKYLELLATRYIHIIENDYQTPIIYDVPTNIKFSSNDEKLSPQKAEIFYRIAEAGNTKRPFLWSSLAAYLSLLNADYDATPKYLSLAQSQVEKNQVDSSMVRLMTFIFKLATAKNIGDDEEKWILSDLNWLRKAKHPNQFLYSRPLTLAVKHLAKKYRSQQDDIKAECFEATKAYYADEGNLAAMQYFLQKKTKTPYENFFSNFYQYNINVTYEHEAILNALRGDLRSSLAIFSKLPDSQLIVIRGNPFNNNIKDCHDCDHEAYKGKPYNAKTLVEKMLEIEQKTIGDSTAFQNSLLLGNAYYNIGHLGNARAFSEGTIIGWAMDGWSIDSSYRTLILSMDNAKKYYQLALTQAVNPEQRAKCHFMLAKCERNEWYKKNFYDKFESYYEVENVQKDFDNWSQFFELKKYLDTKYAKEVLQECGYFKKFITTHR